MIPEKLTLKYRWEEYQKQCLPELDETSQPKKYQILKAAFYSGVVCGNEYTFETAFRPGENCQTLIYENKKEYIEWINEQSLLPSSTDVSGSL